ncbi:MAG TPA: transcriptional regulator [Cytophagaceae bacterium]
MDTITLEKSIKVFYKTASSFPEGVLAAHQSLHALIPYSRDRNYFGISRPENGGGIVYKAAAEEKYPGEGEKLNCETMVIEQGKYLAIDVPDFMKNISAIEKAFTQLISQPGIDPEGYCVEWYINDTDVRCMVRLQ